MDAKLLLASLALVFLFSTPVPDNGTAPNTENAPWEHLGASVERDKSGRLTWLMVAGPTVEDKNLEDSGDFKFLEVLVLGDSEPREDGWRLTDRALANLGTAQKLITLQLRGRGFTDRSMPIIGRLVNLKNLELNHTAITDDGLKSLSHLSCECLDLSGTRVTGKGLKHIEHWKKLDRLELDDTPVGDEALQHVAQGEIA